MVKPGYWYMNVVQFTNQPLTSNLAIKTYWLDKFPVRTVKWEKFFRLSLIYQFKILIGLLSNGHPGFRQNKVYGYTCLNL